MAAKIIAICPSGGHITIQHEDGQREILLTEQYMPVKVPSKDEDRKAIEAVLTAAVAGKGTILEAAAEVAKLVEPVAEEAKP